MAKILRDYFLQYDYLQAPAVETTKEIKLHNNPDHITQILAMGIADRKLARKALKKNGSLERAITALIE